MAIKIFKGWNKDGDTFKVQDERADNLGTASTKNFTSVVTESSDLVESGAVKDIVGWGNKNKLPFPYKDTTRTVSGITFTVIDQSVSVSGLLSGVAPEFNVTEKIADDRYAGLILSCGVSNTSNVFMRIRIGKHSTGAFIRELKGDNLTIPTLGDDEDYFIAIRVEQTTQISPAVVFYPMISKEGGAYEPYHASVDESKCDNSVIGTVEDGTNPTKSYAVGEHFIRNGKFCTVTVAVTTSSTWTLGSNYVEGDVASEFEKYYHGARLSISDLNNLPLGMGYAEFTGDATPTTGYSLSASFICFGNTQDKTVMVYRIGNIGMYVNRYYQGSWSGWALFTGTVVS